ncbi:DUF3048 domain-containing protein [Demequina zhanjiangensis]|uniref:DUF3048 domain-containing protein n=1 Tax=Demequina zhanjiangensis TaxID=3051659 RepID=A0ABT8FWX6_9MICO|nr:DUF3048 domain-containing protein [Demequina sp. SYSU T00b26]MDN4471396.1 DUF3048 domain-containing protein [Demequina sp. SYSU T00b26]
MRVRGGAAVAAAMAILLAACAPAVETSPAVDLTYGAQEVRGVAPSPPEDPRPAVAWPLTGTDAAGVSEADLNNPAISVKIENSAEARPQENLQFADVVYEEYVEAGISRLVAVYHSQMPDTVGPIRSMRPMDKNIMGSYQGPLVFSGAQGGFIQQNANAGLVQITQDRGDYGFYRTSDKRAPHNLHGRMADFLEQAGDSPAPPAQWDFAYPDEYATAQVGGETVSSIRIIMSGWAHPSWDWDAESGTWLRSEWDSPHVTTDGTRLSATNVVILRVRIVTNGTGGGSGVPETLLAGESGEGQLISGDKAIDITWAKGGMRDPIVMKADGQEVSLMPGQTWVELIPIASSVTVS